MEQMYILMEYFIETKITNKLPSVIDHENREKKEKIMKKIKEAIQKKSFHEQPHIRGIAGEAKYYETTRVPSEQEKMFNVRSAFITQPTAGTGHNGP